MKKTGNVYLSFSLHQIPSSELSREVQHTCILQRPTSVNTLVVIYLYCPSAQQGSACPCSSWVTCRRASRGEE